MEAVLEAALPYLPTTVGDWLLVALALLVLCNLRQNLTALDQQVNTLLFGYADETLSARAYRMEQKGHKYWGWTAKAINALFWWQSNHCRGAYRDEKERRQLPPEFRAGYEHDPY